MHFMESLHGHILVNITMALVQNRNLAKFDGLEMREQPAEYENCNWGTWWGKQKETKMSPF